MRIIKTLKQERSSNKKELFLGHGEKGKCPYCGNEGTFDMRYLEFIFLDSIWYNINRGWMCLVCWK